MLQINSNHTHTLVIKNEMYLINCVVMDSLAN